MDIIQKVPYILSSQKIAAPILLEMIHNIMEWLVFNTLETWILQLVDFFKLNGRKKQMKALIQIHSFVTTLWLHWEIR